MRMEMNEKQSFEAAKKKTYGKKYACVRNTARKKRSFEYEESFFGSLALNLNIKHPRVAQQRGGINVPAYYRSLLLNSLFLIEVRPI